MIGRRKGPDPTEVLAAVATVDELAADRLGDEITGPAGDLRARSEGRLGVAPDHTVVALLGPTGSGKSSLTNALAGAEVVTAGVRRPTTSETTAIIWDDEGTDLLEWLEIDRRVRVDGGHGVPGLVLLDVPDFDSIAADHVAEMERIRRRADVLLWVTDPEKYADASLHDQIDAAHEGETGVLVVINKADRLTEAEQRATTTDLTRILAERDLAKAEVVSASATTGLGVDGVAGMLRGRAEERSAALDRLLDEAGRLGAELSTVLGPDDVVDRVDRRRRDLLDELADAAGIETVTDAIVRGHRRDGLAVMGWPITRWVAGVRAHPLRRLGLVSGNRAVASGGDGPVRRSSLPEMSGVQRTRVDGAIRASVDRVADGVPEPWPRRFDDAAHPAIDDLADGLDVALGRAASEADLHRSSPAWWQPIGWLQGILAIAALAGLLWLLALWGLAWLQLPEPPLPEIRGVPWPTALLIGGLALGWLIGLVMRALLTRTGRFRARRFRARARDELETVAEDAVLGPLRAEAEVHDRLRAAATTMTSTRR